MTIREQVARIIDPWAWSIDRNEVLEGCVLNIMDRQNAANRCEATLAKADEIRALIPQPRPETEGGWREIETAPKDGTRILGLNMVNACTVIRWTNKNGGDTCWRETWMLDPVPGVTKWQPLPEKDDE